MKYYAVSTHINQIMTLENQIGSKNFYFYTFFDKVSLPDTYVLTEKLADYTYYTFREFIISSKNTVIAFIGLPETTDIKSMFINYVELPKIPLQATIDPDISALLIKF